MNHLRDAADGESRPRKPLLISFSGIDGAGKTTQIDNLIAWLTQAGLRVRLIRFWDDIAAFKTLRERAGHALFKGEKGVGARGKPVRRRDKDVRSWYMWPVRLVLCAADAWRLKAAIRQLRQTDEADIVIFDRYIYDQLANLDFGNRFAIRYLRTLLQAVPRPDAAFLLDADPNAARERKPEYPLAFLAVNRASYLALSRIVGMTVIAPGPVESVGEAIWRELVEPLGLERGRHLRPVLTSTSG